MEILQGDEPPNHSRYTQKKALGSRVVKQYLEEDGAIGQDASCGVDALLWLPAAHRHQLCPSGQQRPHGGQAAGKDGRHFVKTVPVRYTSTPGLPILGSKL